MIKSLTRSYAVFVLAHGVEGQVVDIPVVLVPGLEEGDHAVEEEKEEEEEKDERAKKRKANANLPKKAKKGKAKKVESDEEDEEPKAGGSKSEKMASNGLISDSDED